MGNTRVKRDNIKKMGKGKQHWKQDTKDRSYKLSKESNKMREYLKLHLQITKKGLTQINEETMRTESWEIK